MMNASVADRQKVLKAAAEAYIREHGEEIAVQVRRAEELGPLQAAEREAAIAHPRHATVAEVRFEAQVRGDDKATINCLARGVRAALAVCRLVDFGRTHLGTGFLVAPGLLITNNHVLPGRDVAGEALADSRTPCSSRPPVQVGSTSGWATPTR